MTTKKGRGIKQGGHWTRRLTRGIKQTDLDLEGFTLFREHHLRHMGKQLNRWRHQESAIRGIMNTIQNPTGAAMLVKALERGVIQPANRLLAVRALGKIKCHTSLRRLEKELKNPEKTVREAAVYALADIGRSAIPVLIDGLKNADSHIRWNIFDALVKIGNPTVPTLEKLLKEEQASNSEAALQSLSRIGGKQATRAIMTGFQHRNERVRWQAVWTLGGEQIIDSTGSDHIVPVKTVHTRKSGPLMHFTLEDLVNAPTEYDLASKKLKEHYSKLKSMPNVMQKLKKLAHDDPSSRVREAASNLLEVIGKSKKS